MKFLITFLSVFAILAFTTLSTSDARRLYMRHRRSVEREGAPSKESTVVVTSDSKEPGSAAEDLPEDLKPTVKKNEKDCKDFFEMDYNPSRDMFMFNGRVPNIFGGSFNPHHHHQQEPHGVRGVNHIQDMFQQMFAHATRMFNRFPMQPSEMPTINENFPDNYNGTVEDIVEIDGQKFRKKQHIINKNEGGVQIHIMSTVYEPVDPPKPEADESAVPEREDVFKDIGNVEPETSPSSTEPSSASSAGSEPEEESSPSAPEASTPKNDLTDGTIVQY